MMIFEGFYRIRGMAAMWVTQISKLILVFLRYYLVSLNQISFESLWVHGNENLYK